MATIITCDKCDTVFKGTGIKVTFKIEPISIFLKEMDLCKTCYDSLKTWTETKEPNKL